MIMAIDLGSTGIRSILVGPEGEILASDYRKILQFVDQAGWLEHDLNDVWQQCLTVCRRMIAVADSMGSLIEGIGITTQRNTLAIWDPRSGEPMIRAISWSDNRTRDLCRVLAERDCAGLFRRTAGRELTTTNIGLKLRWLMDTYPWLGEKIISQSALWGTLDTWLVWKMTEGYLWATDFSNAACTGIYDLVERKWSDVLAKSLELSQVPLPDVRATIGDFGETSKRIFGRQIRIASVVGDQYASLFGQGCIEPGMAKCTLGTGGFCLVNIGHEPKLSIEGITTRLCWHLRGTTTYGIEGVLLHVGTFLEWLCRRMGFVQDVRQMAEVGGEAESAGVFIVPAFSGLATPRWDPEAKAIIVGISLNTEPRHLVRAGLESVAFQLRDLVEVMREGWGGEEIALRLDGQVARNDTLMQIVSDVLETPVQRLPSPDHRSALGASFLAGLETGLWSGLEDLSPLFDPEKVFYPKTNPEKTREFYAGWQDAVKRSRGLPTR